MVWVKKGYSRLFFLLTGGGLALSLVFLSLAGGIRQAASSKPVSPVGSAAPSQKVSPRKTASALTLSKQDILGKGYDRDLDPRPIRRDLNIHLNSFRELCSPELSLRQKASLLDKKIKTLEGFLVKQLGRPYLDVEIQVLLRDIHHILERGVTQGAPSLTEDDIKDRNLPEDFVKGYYVSYNLPEEEKLPVWVGKIARGLHCLYPSVERIPSSSKNRNKTKSL